MKKISVIIPCYNTAQWIDGCMVSIVEQTIGIDDLEIICVDDASTDETLEHLQKWEQRFPEHILLIRQEVKRGREIAENIGLQYASADWIAFVDEDCCLEQEYFERLYKAAVDYEDDKMQNRLINRKRLLEHYDIYSENTGLEMPGEQDSIQQQRLRILQFYSGTESFRFFTDRLSEELKKRGHEIFICDLNDTLCKTEHSYAHLNRFLSKKLDVVICFDGIGTREEQFIQQWDIHQAVVVDILMDPPFRYHSTLEKHPKNYVLFCCDQEHVDYVKKYFSKEVPNVAFMPHVGSVFEKDGLIIPYKERKYDILFSASYWHPQTQMEKIKDLFPNRPDIWELYRMIFENLVLDSSLTIENAVLRTLRQCALSVSDETLKMFLNRSVYVDFAIRMYHRGRVVMALAEAGLDLYLLGPGWEEHPSAKYSNVHRLDDLVPYRKTLDFMADARINLNVMPWFKAGTHDRIFNTLLQHSLPLTDPSSWLTEFFTDSVDIAFYDLDHLERLPDIAGQLLGDPVRAEMMIQKGYEKVSRNLTWSNCADWVLATVDQIRSGASHHIKD